MSNITFYNNAAHALGGAVSMSIEFSPGKFMMSECVLRNNTSPYGGGLCLSVYDNDSIFVIKNSTMLSNKGKHGGAIFASPARLEVEQSLFADNHAAFGAGIKMVGGHIGTQTLGLTRS